MRLPLFALPLALAAACADAAPFEASAPSPAPAVAQVECTVAVAAREVRCGDPAAPRAFRGALIVGGQGTYVQLASSGAAYDSAAATFRMDVTLQNLLGQPVGTGDGVTASGVRIFLDGAPATVAGTGAVEIGNPDGDAFFTGAAQPYFEYPEILAPYERSAPRTWEWAVPATVERFQFRVLVAAAVPNQQGVLRWTRERGDVVSRTLRAVWGTGPSDLWAAGEGTMMYNNGSRWVVIPGDWSGGVAALHGTATDDVWAAGGLLRHFDGRRWSDVPRPAGVALRDVWAPARGTAWFAAAGGMVLRVSGAAWDTLMAPAAGREVSALWGTGEAEVFVAGRRDRPYPQDPNGYVWRWDGVAWDSVAFPGMDLRDVWGSSSTDVYVSGWKGALFHFDGSAWTRVAEGLTGLPFNTVWGTGPDDVWAAGGGYRGAGVRESIVAHFDGSAWREVETDGPAVATAVFAPNPDRVYVVGYRGMIQRRAGGSWSGDTRAVDDVVWSVWPDESDGVYAARCGGVLRGGASGWTEALATGDCLFELWGSADGAELFAAGEAEHGAGGVVHRRAGGAWTRFAFPEVRRLEGVWGLSATEVYAYGYREEEGQQLPVLKRWDGSAWSDVDVGQPWGQIRAVWGSAPDDLYAVGTHVLHFDGTGWSALSVHPSGDVYEDVWGSGPADVYVVGGRIYHFDGAAWDSFSPRINYRAHGVWGSGPADVYVVGGPHLHFNGAAWTEANIEASATLWDVAGASARRVWTAGEGGAVVSGRR